MIKFSALCCLKSKVINNYRIDTQIYIYIYVSYSFFYYLFAFVKKKQQQQKQNLKKMKK